ncbi:RteC domain-containing protein [Flavobacterium phycosphaerae]|uniref:RteC domain-containing protein n=1 Tax=Flavobacterium phycosphaerae TaxID=2697515 RepID=UPI00138A6202|nr:RteC domain-containing protein [Flavobacterium phycosphaerae]
MKLVSESLMSELEHQLKIIHSKTEDPIQYAEQAIKIIITILEKLKTKFLNHQFENKAEEVDFFRNIKPRFAAKLIYYNEIYNIETAKPFGTRKAIRKHYKLELTKLEKYGNENIEFYKYYRTGNNNLDKKYFIRGKHDLRHTLDSFYFQADQRFSTSHDYKVAKILANDNLKVYLESEIAKLDDKQVQSTFKKTQKWTGSKVALIELIYALHAEGVFNNGQSELKEVVKSFESAFGVELGQFHRVFLEIRARKSERTKFLNSLKEKLILRMDDADEI